MPESIRQILYISKATGTLPDTELHEMASKARAKNEPAGITGALLFVENSFVQVIEGKDAAIESLLATLREDKRHRDITILIDRRVPSRDFKNWSMGIIKISAENNAEVVREIDSAGRTNRAVDSERELFPDSQTFLMMKRVYETNQSLQQAQSSTPRIVLLLAPLRTPASRSPWPAIPRVSCAATG